MAGDMTSSVLVFAQQNETETETDNDLQKQNGPIDETFNIWLSDKLFLFI